MPGYLQLVQMSNWGQGDVRAQALSCWVKQVAGSSAFHIYNWCFQARGDENKMGLISLLCLMDRTIITFRFRAKTLKRRHMVLIIRLTVYFELLLTICFNVKKKKHMPSAAALYSPLCLKRSVSAPVSLRPLPLNTLSALTGQLTHAWPSTTELW